MASVKPLVPGTPEKECRAWRVRISVGIKPNYRVIERVVRGPKTKATALANRLETENNDGKISAENATVGKVLARYVLLCESRDRAPNTLVNYRRMAEWITAQCGSVELRRFSGTDIDDLMARVTDEKGASSADHYFRFLRAAMRQAVRWGLIMQAPTDRASAPSVPESEADSPEADEVRRVLAMLEGDDGNADLASLVWTAAVTGTRRGGLCGMTIGDIDFDKAELIHRHAASRVEGKTYIRAPKSKRVRRVAVDPVTMYVLDQQVRRVRNRCKLAGSIADESSFVWSDAADHSEPLNPSNVTSRWRQLARKASLPHTFHHLRHFSATVMLDGDVNPVVVAAQLTHSSPAVTQALYAHVIPTRAHHAAAIVAAVLAPSNGESSMPTLIPQPNSAPVDA